MISKLAHKIGNDALAFLCNKVKDVFISFKRAVISYPTKMMFLFKTILKVKSIPQLKERDTNEEFQETLYGYSHQIEDMIWQLNWRGVDINVTEYFSRVVTG